MGADVGACMEVGEVSVVDYGACWGNKIPGVIKKSGPGFVTTPTTPTDPTEARLKLALSHCQA